MLFQLTSAWKRKVQSNIRVKLVPLLFKFGTLPQLCDVMVDVLTVERLEAEADAVTQMASDDLSSKVTHFSRRVCEFFFSNFCDFR